MSDVKEASITGISGYSEATFNNFAWKRKDGEREESLRIPLQHSQGQLVFHRRFMNATNGYWYDVTFDPMIPPTGQLPQSDLAQATVKCVETYTRRVKNRSYSELRTWATSLNDALDGLQRRHEVLEPDTTSWAGFAKQGRAVPAAATARY